MDTVRKMKLIPMPYVFHSSNKMSTLQSVLSHKRTKKILVSVEKIKAVDVKRNLAAFALHPCYLPIYILGSGDIWEMFLDHALVQSVYGDFWWSRIALRLIFSQKEFYTTSHKIHLWGQMRMGMLVNSQRCCYGCTLMACRRSRKYHFLRWMQGRTFEIARSTRSTRPCHCYNVELQAASAHRSCSSPNLTSVSPSAQAQHRWHLSPLLRQHCHSIWKNKYKSKFI